MASQTDETKAKIPTLLYWNTRALAEPIRLLLAYLDVTYFDERLQVGPPPAYDKTRWIEYKKDLQHRMSFPNLPLWEDPVRGLLLSQTNAILLYVADTYGLPCADAEERARAHMVLEAVREWLGAFFDVTYCNGPWKENIEDGVHVEGKDQAQSSPGFESQRSRYIANALPGYLASFSAQLGSGPWVAGTNLTFADFALVECLDQHVAFHPTLLSNPAVSNLREYYERFLALPRIATYRNSDKFRAEPLHNRYSHFHRGWVGSQNQQ